MISWKTRMFLISNAHQILKKEDLKAISNWHLPLQTPIEPFKNPPRNKALESNRSRKDPTFHQIRSHPKPQKKEERIKKTTREGTHWQIGQVVDEVGDVLENVAPFPTDDLGRCLPLRTHPSPSPPLFPGKDLDRRKRAEGSNERPSPEGRRRSIPPRSSARWEHQATIPSK